MNYLSFEFSNLKNYIHIVISIIMEYKTLCDNFLSDFITTFPEQESADIVAVEQFLEKYKILIERCTDIIIPELDPYKCVDFAHRIKIIKFYSQLAKQHIKADCITRSCIYPVI